MILLISDIHCHYEVINEQIAHAVDHLGHRVSQVLVLGDFGMFPTNLNDHFRKKDQSFRRPVSFIEGNHEDFTCFDSLVKDYRDLFCYLPRTTIQNFDCWNILCLGGTKYMDLHTTPRGCEITGRDIDACLAHDATAVNMVISHDCPQDINLPHTKGFHYYGQPGIPGSPDLAEHFKPRLWFFGHHHKWHDYQADGTRYIGLPRSWQGFCLLTADGEVTCIRNDIKLPSDPWWLRIFGLKK